MEGIGKQNARVSRTEAELVQTKCKKNATMAAASVAERMLRTGRFESGEAP